MDNFLDEEHNWLNNSIALQACQPAISLDKKTGKWQKRERFPFIFAKAYFIIFGLSGIIIRNVVTEKESRFTGWLIWVAGRLSAYKLQIESILLKEKHTPEQSRGVFTRIDQECKIPSINLSLETVSVVTSSRYRGTGGMCLCKT